MKFPSQISLNVESGGCPTGVQFQGASRAAFLLDAGIVKAAGTPWLAIEEVRLLLQLVGRGPVIVAVKQRHIFSAGGMDATRHDCIAAYVLVRQEQPDSLGIFLLIRDDRLARAIRGTVLAHEDLDVETRALSERALQGLRDETRVVVCDQERP